MLTFTEFWKLLENASERIGWYSYLRYGPDHAEESAGVEQNPVQALEAHLEEELVLLSAQFSVSTRSALILLGLMLTWVESDCIGLYLVNAERLSSELSLSTLDLMKFEDEFSELQDKEIIKISDLNLSFISALCLTDPIFADCNGMNEMPSRCPFFNLRFELTEHFCKKLINL